MLWQLNLYCIVYVQIVILGLSNVRAHLLRFPINLIAKKLQAHVV